MHDLRHPDFDIPVISLYGENRKPKSEHLEDLDVLLFDLQDLGVRCYTYGSTLKGVLETAAEVDLPVIICDRPIALPDCIDGPMLNPAFRKLCRRDSSPAELRNDAR